MAKIKNLIALVLIAAIFIYPVQPLWAEELPAAGQVQESPKDGEPSVPVEKDPGTIGETAPDSSNDNTTEPVSTPADINKSPDTNSTPGSKEDKAPVPKGPKTQKPVVKKAPKAAKKTNEDTKKTSAVNKKGTDLEAEKELNSDSTEVDAITDESQETKAQNALRAINILKSAGILSADDKGLPDSPLNRNQFKQMLTKALALRNNQSFKSDIRYPELINSKLKAGNKITNSEVLNTLVILLGRGQSGPEKGPQIGRNLALAGQMGIVSADELIEAEAPADLGQASAYLVKFLTIPVSSNSGKMELDPDKNNLMRLKISFAELNSEKIDARVSFYAGTKNLTFQVAKNAIIDDKLEKGDPVEYILINNKVVYAAKADYPEKALFGMVKAVNLVKMLLIPTGDNGIIELEPASEAVFNNVYADDAVKVILDENNQVKSVFANQVKTAGLIAQKIKTNNGILNQTILVGKASYQVLNNAQIVRRAPGTGKILGDSFDSLQDGDRVILTLTWNGDVKAVEAIPLKKTAEIEKVFEAQGAKPARIVADGITYNLKKDYRAYRNSRKVNLRGLQGKKVVLKWAINDVNSIAEIELKTGGTDNNSVGIRIIAYISAIEDKIIELTGGETLYLAPDFVKPGLIVPGKLYELFFDQKGKVTKIKETEEIITGKVTGIEEQNFDLWGKVTKQIYIDGVAYQLSSKVRFKGDKNLKPEELKGKNVRAALNKDKVVMSLEIK